MKLVKSLLLGSAAGLLAVATSQAADLPYHKSAPVAYVKICDAYGAGYFYIPGTDTCLKVGGQAKLEYVYRSAPTYNFFGANVPSKGRDTTGDWAQARVQLDSRTATGYGTLRAYAGISLNSANGPDINPDGGAYIDKAFIQWAGLTAGHTQTFFSFYADSFNYQGILDPDNTINLLGYTATFGGGFTASISLESNPSLTGGDPYLFVSGDGGANFIGAPGGSGGYRIPDIVGQINLSQGWGSAQLSGAAHQQYVNDATTSWGYAGLAGVNINLPTLAAGDNLYLEGSVGQGALDYLWGNFDGGRYRNYNTAGAGFPNNPAANGFGFGDYDGVVVNGSQKLPSWYRVTAAFKHYFSPQVDASVFGTYINVHYPNSAVFNGGTGSDGVNEITSSFNEFVVGGNVNYHPIKDLTIGVEAMYERLHNNTFGAPEAFLTSNIDQFQGTLHIERDF